ncbi:MAG: ferritin-like domain-containing protein [Myxococcales bacterium]|nr:ferritin-like domain-containing protein [Myxococcales bacterium]
MHKRSKPDPRMVRRWAPGELRDILQGIARCAVLGTAASTAACSSTSQVTADPNMGQHVPRGTVGDGPQAGSESLAPSPTGVEAGGPDSQQPPATTAIGEPIECDAGKPKLLGDITSPLGRPDSLTRASAYREPWADPNIARIAIEEREGSPCSSASDRAKCEDRYAAVTDADSLCGEHACENALVATSGDDVLLATATLGDLASILGEIDTLGEAALVAWLNDHRIGCGAYDNLPVTHVERDSEGFLVRYEAFPCGEPHTRVILRVTSAGEVSTVEREELAPSNCDVGRRPDGACVLSAGMGAFALGRHLATMASLEAASVVSFARIARELAAFGAPRELIERALAAGCDEVRHAHMVNGLCTRFGGRPSPARVAEAPLRNRLSFALDNAVEGCVRETYGALVATYQGMTATDPQARQILTAIAADETRHAQLSWQLAEFIEPQLSDPERTMLRSARVAAVRDLALEPDNGLSPRERSLIGWPDERTSRVLIAQLARAVLPYPT